MLSPCTVWINPSDGVVRKKNESQFNNLRFVSMIHDDKTALGYMMSMRYPASTNITLKGDIPNSWEQWDVPEISVCDIIDKCCKELEGLLSIGEIDGSQRLWIPRKEQSQRMRHIVPYAGFSISPRGINPVGAPKDVIECITQVVAGVYAIVEKNTVASIKNKEKKRLASVRVKKMNTCFDIISRRQNVAEASIISSYSEPSSTTALRLFYLYDVLGKELTHYICDSIYYSLYEDQLHSVEESLYILSS